MKRFFSDLPHPDASIQDDSCRLRLSQVTFGFKFPDLPSEVRTACVAAGWPALRFALRTSTLTTAGFAVFLGGYNGVFCVSERTFGRTWLNPAVSGGMLGAAIGYGAHPSKVSVVAGAAATAALCTATDYAWGPAESRQRRGDRDGDI